MTAAHRALPLGISVRVINRENGREAVVRINDRGPLVKGRIIDLSYAAAKKLGIGRKGSAFVRIEALGFRASGSTGQETYRPPASYDTGTYTVQIGVYPNANNARRLSDEMKKIFGYSEVKSPSGKGERYYRVFAGRYSSFKAAEAAERNFTEHGYPASFVLSLE